MRIKDCEKIIKILKCCENKYKDKTWKQDIKISILMMERETSRERVNIFNRNKSTRKKTKTIA